MSSTLDLVADRHIEAEQCVLGSMLLSDRVFRLATETMNPEQFYTEPHRAVFSAMQRLRAKDACLDILTLEAELGDLKMIGGHDYLFEISMSTPSPSNAETYMQIVFEKWQLRKDKQDARRLMRMAEEGSSPEERRAFKVGLAGDARATGAVVRHISDFNESMEGSAVTTTWTGLDQSNWRKGFSVGQVTVAKGKTGGGKSTWCMSTAFRMAEKGLRVLYATFADLAGDDVKYRALRSMTGFSTPYTLEQDDALKTAKTALSLWDFEIYDACECDTGDTEIENFAAWLDSRMRNTTYDVAFLDYAQEIQSNSKKAKDDFAEQRIIARSVRVLAQKTNLPFIVASQVNEDERTASSKAWERIACLILMIQDDGLRIDKNRFGPKGATIPHKFDKAKQVYVDR